MSAEVYEIIDVILNVCSVFFLVYLIGYSTFLFASVVAGASALYQKKRQERLKNTLMEDYYVPISIIVPAYNEEVTVVETVRSLLALDYKLYEIIVVDDGSKDETATKLIEAFDMHRIRRPMRRQVPCKRAEFVYECISEKVSITLVRKENGGKADALNMGINVSKFPYFICMDADSMLQHDSLARISRPILEYDNIVAVGGTVRPVNGTQLENGRVNKYRMPRNLLAAMQVLEYDRSFLAARILFDMFNGSLIISGAFGAFKKDVVIQAGGYDTDTVGEDMELVIKLHDYCRACKMDYRIKYATDAICWTQVPENMKDLFGQRKRWHRGLFQSMWKHRNMFCNPNYGLVSFISYLYFLVYELLSPFIEVFGMITVVLAYITNVLNVGFMIMFFVIYAVFGTIMSLTAFFTRTQTVDLKLTPGDAAKAVLLCFFEVTCLRMVMAFARMSSFFGYKKGKNQWKKIQRKEMNWK